MNEETITGAVTGSESVAGGADTVTTLPQPEKSKLITVNFSGAVVGTVQLDTGESVEAALKQLKVADAKIFMFRDAAGKPVALTHKLTEDIAITAVPKTKQG